MSKVTVEDLDNIISRLGDIADEVLNIKSELEEAQSAIEDGEAPEFNHSEMHFETMEGAVLDVKEMLNDNKIANID